MKKETLPVISVLNLYKSLSEIATEKYPAKVAYAIGKNLRTLWPVVLEFEQKKQEIVKKYGSFNDETKQFEFVDALNGQAEFEAEVNPLLVEEKEVEVHKVTADMFNESMISSEKLAELEDFGFIVNRI